MPQKRAFTDQAPARGASAEFLDVLSQAPFLIAFLLAAVAARGGGSRLPGCGSTVLIKRLQQSQTAETSDTCRGFCAYNLLPLFRLPSHSPIP